MRAIGPHGSLDVTMSDIAREAGVSPALAHHYFGSKQQLLVATTPEEALELLDEAAGRATQGMVW